MINLIALVSGLIFGLGLILAGMANPAKVLAFLDLTGDWDPSLAFVMAGAIAVGSVAFALAGKLKKSYLGTPMSLPTSRIGDKRLGSGRPRVRRRLGNCGDMPGSGPRSAGARAAPKVSCLWLRCFWEWEFSKSWSGGAAT